MNAPCCPHIQCEHALLRNRDTHVHDGSEESSMVGQDSFGSADTGEFPVLPPGHEAADCNDCHSPLCLLLPQKSEPILTKLWSGKS